MALTGKQRRFLRAQGHHLTAVVQVGKDGASETVCGAVDAALTTHELIKVKVGNNAPAGRHQLAAELAAGTASELVQVLGNTILLYRRHPEQPRLELPG